jgi:hypothetical protein
MSQTTEAMSAVDAKVEVKIGAGLWTDIGGSSNSVKPDGFDRNTGEAFTFVGDSAIKTRGKKKGGTVVVGVIYTENVAEAYLLLYNAFLAGDHVQVRWTPAGGATGDMQFTSDALGFIEKALPPGLAADSADPIMEEFTISCGAIDNAVLA